MAADGSGNIRELKNFIGGEFVASGNTFENTTPIDGTLLSHVHEATKEMVDNAVIAAQKASKIWAKMPVEARCKILYAVADGIDARSDEFIEAETLDTGKPRSLASHVDIPRGAANFRVFADLIKSVGTEAYQQDTPDGLGAFNYSIRHPHG
ncbi:unnamed protein product, partial [Laminaria digitata]